MSALLPVAGSLNAPKNTTLTDTNRTDVYENELTDGGGETFEWVIGIGLTNVDGSNSVDATLEWYDGTNNLTFFKKTVAAKDTEIIPSELLIRLAPGWKIKATASAANDLVVTVITVRAS